MLREVIRRMGNLREPELASGYFIDGTVMNCVALLMD